MDLSFSGAGFMGCYYFGVIDCWNKYVPRARVNRTTGSSAGSLIAAYYLMDMPLSQGIRSTIEMIEGMRSRPLGVFDRKNQVVDLLPQMLDDMFPDDAHKRVHGRLFVCMTRLKDMKKVVVSEFETRKDLIDALNCSCFIPVWSGNHVSTYKGVKHIDGGFSDNLPTFDERTIRICCFSGSSDISPYDRVKMEMQSTSVANMPLYLTFANCKRARKALFPPPPSFVAGLVEQGFHDAKNFILDNDLIQCDSCYANTSPSEQPLYKLNTPMLTPSVSPAISRAPSMRIAAPNASGLAGGPHGNTLQIPGFQSAAAAAPLQRQGSFKRTLHAKLTQHASQQIEEQQQQDTQQHSEPFSISVPIVITTTTTTTPCSGSPNQFPQLDASKRGTRPTSAASNHDSAKQQQQQPATRAVSADKPPRRASVQAMNNSLAVLQDRFKSAADPLPCVPPSPNLNRHCTECIRLRQAARVDLISDDIRMQIYKNIQQVPVERDNIKNKISSPLRWFRQLGSKNSYRFYAPDVPSATVY